MNFSEWYKFGTPEEQNCFMGDAEKGWEACKEEVLTSIKNIDVSQRNAYLVLIELKQKIEKL